MSDHTYQFNVTMNCGGCSGAIERVLGKLGGVKSYEVALGNPVEKGTVKVIAEPTLPYPTVRAKIEGTGKQVGRGWVDGVLQDD